jgi:hypothetical protein
MWHCNTITMPYESNPFIPFNWFTANMTVIEYYRHASNYFHDFTNVLVNSVDTNSDRTILTGKTITYEICSTGKSAYKERPYTIHIHKVSPIPDWQHEGCFVVHSGEDYVVDTTLDDPVNTFPCFIRGDTDIDIQKRWQDCPKYRTVPLNLELISKLPESVVKMALISVSLEI